jgi:hypothetical protein
LTGGDHSTRPGLSAGAKNAPVLTPRYCSWVTQAHACDKVFPTMASSESGGSDSWPGFLSELTKSFLILRDIFGYALPGAVFLSIGVLLKRFSLHDVQYFLEPYNLPVWLAVVLGIGACYVVGHLMAQIAYFLFNTWKWPFSRKLLFWRRKPASVGHQVAATDGTRTETDSAGPGKCAPTQVSVELISLRGHIRNC